MHSITEFFDFPTFFDEAEEIKEEEMHIEENPTESRGTRITCTCTFFFYYIMFIYITTQLVKF